MLLGVLPTPAIAFVAAERGVPAAIVSASHNRWSDNGVKVIGADGRKLADGVEAEIEAELELEVASTWDRRTYTHSADDSTFAAHDASADAYVTHLLSTIEGRDLGGLGVVLDCANGAGFELGPRVLRAAGARVHVLHAEPDGHNINDGCGSTYPESLQRAVVDRGAALGLALDGDGDRVLAVDEHGVLVDGDQIMTMAALDMHARGMLRNNAIAVTVMSNLGLRRALRAGGIDIVETPVGDRHVVTAMQTNGFVLGGEQSGHIVFSQYATTGDGLLTGLLVADLVRRTGRSVSALGAQMERVPQVLVNVPVARRVDIGESAELADAVREVETGLGDAGRVSGAGVGDRAPRAGDDRGRRAVGGRPGRGADPQSRGLAIRARRHALAPRPRRESPCPPCGSMSRSTIPGMCGIVGVLGRPGSRVAPDLIGLRAKLVETEAELARMGAELAGEPTVAALEAAAGALRAVDRQLREGDGVGALVGDPVARAGLVHQGDRAAARLVEIEARLDASALDGADIEALNAALVTCKDALWSIRHDRIGLAVAVEELIGGAPSGPAALDAFHAIQITLSAIDRLEVRGRDSAGLHVVVTGHGLDLDDPAVARLVARRSSDPLFTAGSVRTPNGGLAFVYKTAAEIGELGDNTARLRAQIRDDDLLHLALRADTAQASVLAHTRWASIGIISEANAHPLNQEELDADGQVDKSRSYTIAALNGDVDNYADLKALDGLHFPAEITTDAKVIPALVARRTGTGVDLVEAFRSTVASFEGSVAIALQSTSDPDCLLLAQRGSGQALYVGLAPDSFVVASEPYGLVAECRVVHPPRRRDHDRPGEPGEPRAGRGARPPARRDAGGGAAPLLRRA